MKRIYAIYLRDVKIDKSASHNVLLQVSFSEWIPEKSGKYAPGDVYASVTKWTNKTRDTGPFTPYADRPYVYSVGLHLDGSPPSLHVGRFSRGSVTSEGNEGSPISKLRGMSASCYFRFIVSRVLYLALDLKSDPRSSRGLEISESILPTFLFFFITQSVPYESVYATSTLTVNIVQIKRRSYGAAVM